MVYVLRDISKEMYRPDIGYILEMLLLVARKIITTTTYSSVDTETATGLYNKTNDCQPATEKRHIYAKVHCE